LETALKRGIFFNVLAVFIERGGADAVQFAARQGRFEHIARIHRAIGFARTHQGVDFINKNHGLAIVFGQIVQHRFERSSNSPRNLAPAISAAKSSTNRRLF
jgi:hypothetical protein